MGRSRDTADVVESKNQCTAWAAYNPLTQTLLDGYNIQSVTYIATGKYRFTFSSQMSNSNYSVICNGEAAFVQNDVNNEPNSIDTFHIWSRSGSLADYDGNLVSVQVFGGKA